MSIPNDPIILLSYVNTQLRDHYNTLDDLCKSLGIDENYIINKLQQVDYIYDHKLNQFV